MKLPNWELAIVEPEKARDYLLDRGHRDGGPKARFFEILGYRQADWESFARDLVTQIAPLDVDEFEETEYGLKYNIVGMLNGPLRSAKILSVWFLDIGKEAPRLVTAYPEPD